MGHDNHRHEVSEKKTQKDESDDSAKKMVTDGQNNKDNQKVIEHKKNNPEANKAVKNLFGDVSIDFNSKAPLEGAAEAELTDTSDNKTQPLANMKNLAGVMDQETIAAVRRNEEKKAGFEDTIQDNLPYSWAQSRNWSIGPAQMQTKHIDELKADPRYAEQLKDADPYTAEGSDKLIAAYLDRESERLNNGEYAAGKTGRPRGDESKEGQRFEALQQRWNEAKNGCNPDEMRKILIETYNSGNGSTQVAEVEAIRTGGEATTAIATLSTRPEPVSQIPRLDSKAAA